jgi:hypothetical protein
VETLSDLLRASPEGKTWRSSRQRVNRALQVLEKAGLLKVEYGRIRILDLDGLRGFND